MPYRIAQFIQGRKLSDGQFYIISLYDCEHAGILIRAYRQHDAYEYTLSPTQPELNVAKINRDQESFQALAESVDVQTENGRTFLTSNLGPLKKPKVIPTKDDAKKLIENTKAGADCLPDLLVKGLSELCRAKPAGLDAVQWLGEWLLANNPNQPQVAE